jgi:hypothetical protein
VRVQDGQPDIAVRAVIIVEACVAAPSERWCRRNAERNALPALPDLTSCTRLLYVCVYPLPLLSVTCRYGAEALRRFAAGSSATTALQLFPDFRPRCSGCAEAPHRRQAVPHLCVSAAYTVGECPRVA